MKYEYNIETKNCSLLSYHNVWYHFINNPTIVDNSSTYGVQTPMQSWKLEGNELITSGS